MWDIIVTVVVGALVGYLAGLIMKSRHGFLMNCVLGIVGSFIGFAIAGVLGLGANNLLGTVLIDLVGTCALIALVRLVLGKKW